MTNNTAFSQDAIIRKHQAKAQQLDPDGTIEKYFSGYSFVELLRMAGYQSKRFLPAVVADAVDCSRCGEEFNWDDPQITAYIPQFEGYDGEAMPKAERDLFFLDIDSLSEMVVCANCKTEMLNRYLSLMCCAWAAARREQIEKEQSKLDAARVEKLIRDTAQNVYLFAGEDDDGGALLDYILNRFIDYSALVEVDSAKLQQAFQNKKLYFYLFEDRDTNRTPEFWARVVDEFSRAGA